MEEYYIPQTENPSLTPHELFGPVVSSRLHAWNSSVGGAPAVEMEAACASRSSRASQVQQLSLSQARLARVECGSAGRGVGRHGTTQRAYAHAGMHACIHT